MQLQQQINMSQYIDTINYLASVATMIAVVFGIILLLILLAFAFGKRNDFTKLVVSFVGGNTFKISFIFSILAIIGSIFYSDFVGYAACALCWWQRVFLYPQAIIFGVATYSKEKSHRLVSVILSVIGGVIASYNVFLQFGGNEFIPCPVGDIAVSCAKRYFLEFGFVTIPTMSLVVFILILIFMFAHKLNEKNQKRLN